MTRILLLGYDPQTVDFSDPALPSGMTAEKINAGIEVALKQFASRGWEADLCYIRPDETAGPSVERQLASTRYDCVVIGAGVRLPPRPGYNGPPPARPLHPRSARTRRDRHTDPPAARPAGHRRATA